MLVNSACGHLKKLTVHIVNRLASSNYISGRTSHVKFVNIADCACAPIRIYAADRTPIFSNKNIVADRLELYVLNYWSNARTHKCAAAVIYPI